MLYSIDSPNGTFVLTVGRRQAQWNGFELWLGFAPQTVGGETRVHAVDAARNLAPLLAETEPPAGTNRVLVIDPGHGGLNSGARSVLGNRLEKEFTLDWAFRLQRRLEDLGWQVSLTRTNDVDLSLPERVGFAEECGAALFISLHFNSGPNNGDAAGLETYCVTPRGLPSTLVRGNPDDADATFPNNAFDSENLRLAVRLHRELVRRTAEPDRGVRRARFMGVLGGQNRPAVLIEGGYLSNPREAGLIASPDYRQALAEAVAEALGPAPTQPEDRAASGLTP